MKNRFLLQNILVFHSDLKNRQNSLVISSANRQSANWPRKLSQQNLSASFYSIIQIYKYEQENKELNFTPHLCEYYHIVCVIWINPLLWENLSRIYAHVLCADIFMIYNMIFVQFYRKICVFYMYIEASEV